MAIAAQMEHEAEVAAKLIFEAEQQWFAEHASETSSFSEHPVYDWESPPRAHAPPWSSEEEAELSLRAVALGAEYQQAQALQLHRQGRRIASVTLSDGSSVRCSVVINAAGTGARQLALGAGIALPVESRKRSVFFFSSPAHIGPCPLVIDPGGAYFRPEGNGFICGVSPPEDQDPECFDFEVQHALFDNVLWPALAARVPGFESARVRNAWAGHYDVNTLDHNVILGAHPDVDNLLFANGFSGHGMQQAAAVGRALSELVAFGGYRTLDLSAMGWSRVLGNRPLREVNVV
jgi:glycine/D-amino acid oxidase-like deaminating enzyme